MSQRNMTPAGTQLVTEEVLRAELFRVFGHREFRGRQLEIIQHCLQGQSALVVMPTGDGKSLCYQLPALVTPGMVLVISPLIALMQDQVEKLRALGIPAIDIHSNLSADQKKQRVQQLSEGQYRLAYVTPERFRNSEFREAIQKCQVAVLAIDEAHCISQWGHDFRPDYSRLGDIRKFLGSPPTLALTATATRKVQKDILAELNITDARTFIADVGRPNLHYQVHEVHGLDEKVRNIVGLHHLHSGSAIVYLSLISTLEKISTQLQRLGIAHLVYHGNLNPERRRSSLQSFMQNPAQLMLATPAFGLGVDKPNIRLVVHAEIPGSIEAYFQEAGRAGRDGDPAECHLLLDEDDLSIQMEFIKWSNPEPDFVDAVYRLIQGHRLRLEQEGMDFLRSQMNFYNKRDFRVETAVNWLERWGCLQKDKSRFGYACVAPPDWDETIRQRLRERVKIQSQQLLDMLQLARLPSQEIPQKIADHFSQE